MSSAHSLAQIEIVYPVWCLYGESARRISRNWAAAGMLGMSMLLLCIFSQFHPKAIVVVPAVRREVIVMETYELPPLPDPVQEFTIPEPEKIIAEDTEFRIVEKVPAPEPLVQDPPIIVPLPVTEPEPLKKQEELRPSIEAKPDPVPLPEIKQKEARPPVKAKKRKLRTKPDVPVKPTQAADAVIENDGAVKSVPSQNSESQPVTATAGNAHAVADKSKILARIIQAVERYKKYPKAARRSGAEGKLELTITISPDGKIASCNVSTPSGKSVLDAAGEQLGKKLTGLDVGAKQSMTVVVPVNYRLSDD